MTSLFDLHYWCVTDNIYGYFYHTFSSLFWRVLQVLYFFALRIQCSGHVNYNIEGHEVGNGQSMPNRLKSWMIASLTTKILSSNFKCPPQNVLVYIKISREPTRWLIVTNFNSKLLGDLGYIKNDSPTVEEAIEWINARKGNMERLLC